MSNNIQYPIVLCVTTAVQNERDRISSRRPSYEEPVSANGLTISVLINAETMSRQVKIWLLDFYSSNPLNLNYNLVIIPNSLLGIACLSIVRLSPISFYHIFN